MTEIDRDQEAALRSYLLGLAPAEEQKRVEERLLSDSDYFNQLQRAEECLTDEYVCGQIQGIEKERFDSHFLKSTEHREGLEFARLLDRYFSEQDIARNISLPSAPKWRAVMEVVLASVAILSMAASTLLFRQVSNLHSALARLQQERTAPNARELLLSAKLAAQQQAVKELTEEYDYLHQLLFSRDSDIVLVSLHPGLVRTGTNVRRVVVPAHAQALHLELRLPVIHYRNYSARIETAEGDVVWTANDLVSHPGYNGHRVVTLVLPVAPITRSQYLVRLTGTTRSGTRESVATYYLNIIKK